MDTETTGLTWWDEPFCVTVAWSHDGQVRTHYIELGGIGEGVIRDILRYTPELVMHNAKFDVQKLQLVGLLDDHWEYTIHDTQALAHLLDEHRKLSLKGLARDLLGVETTEETEIKEWFKAKKIKKADQNYADLPREILMPYAMKDVDFTIRLFNRLYPQVMADDGLKSMYEMEMELTHVLLDMEDRGLGIDVPYLEKTAREYAKRGLQLELHLRELSGIDDFNPNSPVQVVKALNQRGFPVEASNKDTLKTIEDAFAQEVLEIRSVRKIHGTYLLGLLAEQRGGILHPWTRQHKAVTGRMSSGGVEQ